MSWSCLNYVRSAFDVFLDVPNEVTPKHKTRRYKTLNEGILYKFQCIYDCMYGVFISLPFIHKHQGVPAGDLFRLF